MADEPLALYIEAFWLSPWTCTAFVALREKGLSFQTGIAMLRHGVGAKDALRDKTLTGTAPVLQHGTMFIAESLAIIEYLEETFATDDRPRILPADRRERARARQLLSWLRIGTSALRNERPTEHIFYPPATRAPLSATARRDLDDVAHVAERLGAGASGRLFADTFGVVDVDMAFALKRAMTGGTEVPAAIAASPTRSGRAPRSTSTSRTSDRPIRRYRWARERRAAHVGNARPSRVVTRNARARTVTYARSSLLFSASARISTRS